MENVPSTSQECPTTGPIYNLRPFTRKGPRQKRFPAQLSRSHSVAQSFTKEVILLPDHLTTHVPRRNKKAWLFENGHIKSALEFSCDWDSDKVMQAIRTAFQPVLEGCRLQILLACHTKLVEPSLTSKQTLNGDLVKKLFHQKSIYVRPDKVILCEDNESTYSDGESSHTSRQDFTETLNSDKCVEISKEVPSAIPIVNAQSMSVDDEVIWCVATQDVCTVESSISADTLTMSTNPAVVATDEDEPYSSGTSAFVSYNTPGLSAGSSASVTGDTRVFSSNTSSVSNGPTQPSLSSTSYRHSPILVPMCALVKGACKEKPLDFFFEAP
ncbi:uncharacterized protein LOC112436027 [Maylandia zebra]|uniref:uncharacterized protein LOC112436027 n=1 Tax=Maylandia zebra TaxID=106582 RepID=UPI000D2FCF6A|nr:uncharacterized protein LOC112436027 [Maylandia zebra]